MYERLTKLGRGIENRYYDADGLEAQKLQISGSSVSAVNETVNKNYVCMQFAD